MRTTRETDPVAWLRRLVACPSVNPLGGPADAPPFGEARLHRMLGETLREWGADVTFQDAAPGRTNLVARFKGPREGLGLMLESHGDTVSVEGMTIDPFAAEIRDGRLYGRGACDTKGSMAAMLAGLAAVLERDGRPPCDVCFVAVCNEEQGATGARLLMESGFRADGAVVGEPTSLRIVDAHKGIARFTVEVAGRAAHSSDPKQGVNAISRMAAVVACIDGPLSAELARTAHPRLGPPVISVGVIRGGVQVNVVPDRCVIEVDRRLLPGETAATAEAQLRRHLDAWPADPPLRYRIRPAQVYAPLDADRSTPLARAVEDAVEAVTGAPVYEAAPWGSDAGIYHAAGIPSLLLGPGSIAQAHCADEYVDLDEVRAAARIYAEIIRRFGATGEL